MEMEVEAEDDKNWRHQGDGFMAMTLSDINTSEGRKISFRYG